MSDPYIDNEFIPVVAAVITDEHRLLLCQRQDGPHLPLLWEFPGGKVDPGEGPTENSRGAARLSTKEGLDPFLRRLD